MPRPNSAASLYQYYQYKPVLWRGHAIEELGTVRGDPVGTAVSINNHGEAAETTGTCSAYNLLLSYYMNPLHAVLWEKDGTPGDLGSLGGDSNSVMGNAAKDINSFGHVVGYSSLADDAHGVPTELNTLIPAGCSLHLIFGCSINSRGEILGLATDLTGTVCHANELIPDGE